MKTKQNILTLWILCICFNSSLLKADVDPVPKFVSLQIDTLKYKNPYWDSKNMITSYGYYQKAPKQAVGVIVLLPGFGRQSLDIFSETKIDELALKNGYAVIAPTLNQSFGWDTTAFGIVNACIGQSIKSLQISNPKVILGGLSAGGGISLMYAIASVQFEGKYIKPTKVFAVDSPVDMVQLHYTMLRTIASNCGQRYVNEAKWIVDDNLKRYGGDPKEVPEGYIKDSPFCRDCQDGGNAKYLVNYPVNLYTEPDIHWNLAVRCADYSDMNAFGLAGLTRYLQLAGNKKAHLVTSENRGHDKAGNKNPHTWPIVEEVAFMKWVLE